jgi:ABC-type transport system involved in cytochrome c biogenesis ATPase subunit
VNGLIIEGLSLERGGHRLLSGLSFACACGQALRIKGVNGIGKTTVLRAIAGLYRLRRGRIQRPKGVVAYHDVRSAMYRDLTVAEQSTYWSLPATFWKKGGVADRIGLLNHLTQSIASLSAGQQQRLSLLPLLNSVATLWVLDEPDNHLDIVGRLWLTELLTGALTRGVCVVYTSQGVDLLAGEHYVLE